MKYTVAAYFDKDTNKFNPAFLMPFAEEDTIETVEDGCKKGKIEGCEAFVFYILGMFDTETGKFILESEPKKIFDCSQYVKGQ